MSLRLLVLGGTSWLGGAVARLAGARGHEVVCLARGRSGRVPDGVGWVAADRWDDGAYAAVADRDWDAVFDVSWQPELVRSALHVLAGRAGRWLYVSSASAYLDDADPRSTVLHRAWTGSGPAAIEEYGPAKVACEAACRGALGDRLLVARAGLIAGYGDRSDRFGYWPGRLARVARAREAVLVPPMHTPVQVIDVEDLASWLVTAAESRTVGTFDAVGDAVTFEELLGECVHAVGTPPVCAEPDQEWLVAHGVNPWMGADSLPLWLPMPAYAGLVGRDNGAARRAGLTLRPLAETVAAALAWERELGLQRERTAGLSAGREAQLVAALLGERQGGAGPA